MYVSQIFMLIIINLYQLSIMSAFFNYFRALGAFFIPPKICPGLIVFNNILPVIGVRKKMKNLILLLSKKPGCCVEKCKNHSERG